jgi:excisionase family DNA binding protein
MTDLLAFTIAEACSRASASRTSLYAAIASGDLVARKRGRRTLILAEDLSKWLNATPAKVPTGSAFIKPFNGVAVARPPNERARTSPTVFARDLFGGNLESEK